MKKRTSFLIFLTLLLALTLALALNTRLARASATIYIRPDGSVDPPTAPISRAGDLYTFTADIYESIVIQKDYVTVDGNGFSLQGSGNGFEVPPMVYGVSILRTTISGFSTGVYVLMSGSAHIEDNIVTSNGRGIEIVDSSGCSIIGNTLSNSVNAGIRLYSTVTGCTIDGNSIQNSGSGIHMEAVFEISHNIIVNNLIGHNAEGVRMDSAAGTVYANSLYHNNFIDNTQQVSIIASMYPSNSWDNGYPSGGNYWNDYTDVDQFKGAYQDEIGSDGIWDHPYGLAANNVDHYPFTQQSGWESPPPPPPPPLPEFPLGSAMPMAAIPLLLYLWWKAKKKTPP